MISDIEFVTIGAADESSAACHRPFWVQCNSRCCLAYCHRDGKWRNFDSGVELTDFVRVIDEE